MAERIATKEQLNQHILAIKGTDEAQRIMLGILYMAEGTKRASGNVTFGNSDPEIIALFLRLLRNTFDIDESKFRCTLQARADQDIAGLERFWSEVTQIPADKFYKARIDPRSLGKETRKKVYKGVCRIDYLSSELLCELMVIGSMLKRARSSSG